MGEADGGLLVQVQQQASALLSHLDPVVDGLAAAAGTPRRAGHHLDEVVPDLPVSDRLAELAHVLQPVGHGDV